MATKAKPPAKKKRLSASKGVPKRKELTPVQRASLDKAHAAAKGNAFWQMRSRHGIQPIFPVGPEGARMLREACEDYFAWCLDNPLMEAKPFSYEGFSWLEEVPKLRAFTLNGLTLFIDITDRAWRDWRTTRQDLVPVIEWAEKTIKDQKFVAAAAGLLNANIISRDLGLADKHEMTGPGGGALQTITTEMTAQEAADLYAQTREAGKK